MIRQESVENSKQNLLSWTSVPSLSERGANLNRQAQSSFLDRHRGVIRTFGAYFAWAGVGFVVTSIFLVVLFGFLPVPVTPLMILRSSSHLFDDQPIVWKKDWVSIERISNPLQSAAIAAEDARFMDHFGFDFEAIEKALRANRNARHRRLRGGSTISQQVAKNVFLWPSRSWVRKGFEVYFTALIELFWSKRRILEVYLNVVEFGDGVYGVEAAAQTFFRKPAAKLNSSEAALLVAVLPNPRQYSVVRPSRYIRFRQHMIKRRIPFVQASQL